MDERLFPGWNAMIVSTGCGWHSLTPGWHPDNIEISTSVPYLFPGTHESVDDLCRSNSTIYRDPDTVLEVRDGIIVAEWWRGGRFAPRDSYAREDLEWVG